MCDRIPIFQSTLHRMESELDRLYVLLEKCKEKMNSPYKCNLIAERIGNKKNDINAVQDILNTNVKICNLYYNLDKELSELPNP